MQDNVCDSGTCKCGTSTACTAGAALGSCRDANGDQATIGDTTATNTCKVTNKNLFKVLQKFS